MIASPRRTCEICSFSNTPGMRPSGPLPAEVQAAVYAALGQASPDEYVEDTHSQVCPECNGFGEVATGSKVGGQAHLSCVNCTGLGWVVDPRARELQALGYAVIPPYHPPS